MTTTFDEFDDSKLEYWLETKANLAIGQIVDTPGDGMFEVLEPTDVDLYRVKRAKEGRRSTKTLQEYGIRVK